MYYDNIPVRQLIFDTTFETWKCLMVHDDEMEPLLYRFMKMKSLAVFYHHCPYKSAGTSFLAGRSPGADGAGGLVIHRLTNIEEEPIHLKLGRYGDQWYVVKAI